MVAAAASTFDFLSVGIASFLNADRRPAIVLDCLSFGHSTSRVEPIFTNTAFDTLGDESPTLFIDSVSLELATCYSAFLEWATSCKATQGQDTFKHVFAGLEWQQFDISGRWRVISSIGNAPDHAPSAAILTDPHCMKDAASQIAVLESETISNALAIDRTISAPSPHYSDHVKFVRERNWRATSAGAIEDWPYQLRMMMNMIMADPSPAVLFWGDDLIMLYNEAYLNIAGSKHPELMGQSVTVGWAHVWNDFLPIFEKGRATGQATMIEDLLLFIDANGGNMEESYLTLTIIPLLGEKGSVTCFYETVTDVTRQVLSQRRMNILLEISHLTSATKTLKEYWQGLLATIERFKIDAPLAVLYSLDSQMANAEHGMPGSSTMYWIKGAVGIPHDSLEPSFDVNAKDNYLAEMFEKAHLAGGHITISDNDKCWPEHIMKLQDKARGFGDTCEQASVYLLRPSNGTVIRGLLIVGLNRRQPYHHHHQLFRHTFGRQIASSMASIVLLEDEVRNNQRRNKQAATDRALLSEELLQRARDSEILENRFFRIAQLSPVAIFVLNNDGSIIYANDKWYAIIGISKSDRTPMPWNNAVWPEDAELVQSEWSQCVEQGVPISFEFRFIKPHKPSSYLSPDSREGAPYLWVLASAYPDILEDGTFLSITGTLTDISQQKWAEIDSEKKAKEALESKRQQENFMDMYVARSEVVRWLVADMLPGCPTRSEILLMPSYSAQTRLSGPWPTLMTMRQRAVQKHLLRV